MAVGTVFVQTIGLLKHRGQIKVVGITHRLTTLRSRIGLGAHDGRTRRFAFGCSGRRSLGERAPSAKFRSGNPRIAPLEFHLKSQYQSSAQTDMVVALQLIIPPTALNHFD